MSDNLKSTAIKGARWGFIENFSSMAVTFIVGFVLARWFLGPEEYGLIGELTIFIAISISLIDNGFSAAIIRKPNPSREDLSTTFITNFAISLVCFGILFAGAPLVASYFAQPQLTALLRVLSLVLIFNAVSIIQRVLIVKAIDFKRLTVCSLSSSLLSGVVGIGMAFRGYGVWSLVGQQLTKQASNSIMLWILGHWKFELKFSFKSFKELFGYGSNVMFTGILDTLFKNIYYPVIGKSFSAAQLGQYTRADQFANVASNNLSQIVQRVSFSVLAKTQESDERMRNAFRTIIKVTMLVSFFAGFWLFASSKPLILGLLGEKWAEAAGLLSVIALAGMFYPAHALNQNILQIKGRMRLYLSLEILKKLLLAVSIVIGIIARSLNVLLWGMVVVSVLIFFINAWFAGKYIGYSLLRQVMDIIKPFIVSLASALLIATLYDLLSLFAEVTLDWYSVTWTNLSILAAATLCALLLIFLVYRIFPGKELDELKKIIKIGKS